MCVCLNYLFYFYVSIAVFPASVSVYLVCDTHRPGESDRSSSPEVTETGKQHVGPGN